jgi:DNA polymerase III gamma/tau subunit
MLCLCLATTEAHKLPETIISRTQRFDLRPITTQDLVSRLEEIAASEKIVIDRDALEMIARASRGGFRDAIGLLDQLSVLNEKLTVEQVAAVLGMAARADILEIIEAIAAKDSATALTKLEALISSGNEPQGLTGQLLEEIREDLLRGVIAGGKQESVLDGTQAAWAIECLTKALGDFKITQHYSLPLELALYRASVGVSVAPLEQAAVQRQQESRDSTQSTPKPKIQEAKKASAKPNAEPSADEQSLCTKGLSLIKERNNSLYAVMRSANPHIEDNKLVLECRFSFHKERMEEQKNRQLIEQIMSKSLGRDIMLNCRLTKTSEEKQIVDSGQELVASALEILGGEVVNG